MTQTGYTGWQIIDTVTDYVTLRAGSQGVSWEGNGRLLDTDLYSHKKLEGNPDYPPSKGGLPFDQRQKAGHRFQSG